ncbi:hypothetical protein D3C72_2522280 [compost metagenome]
MYMILSVLDNPFMANKVSEGVTITVSSLLVTDTYTFIKKYIYVSKECTSNPSIIYTVVIAKFAYIYL